MEEVNNDYENNFDGFIFKNKPEEYKSTLDPVTEYIKQMSKFVSKQTQMDLPQAVKFVKEQIKNKKAINPIVKYYNKKDNGDTEIVEDTMSNYLKDFKNNGYVMAPSYTMYAHPKVKKSLHAEFLTGNIKKRKEDKHNEFKYKQLGDVVKTQYYNVLQKVRKVDNNSLSGAYASPSTILANPSAHYTLTSITRCVASIGNAISESIVAGNKHFRNPEILLNYVISIITSVNLNTVEFAVDKFKLHKPTPLETMQSLLYSSDNYWKDLEFEKELLILLEKLTPYELAAIVYNNDLWHLKKYNEEFVKTLLFSMAKKVETGSIDKLKDLDKAPEGINILTHHIWMDEIKGMDINYKDLKDKNPELLDKLASTTRNINITLDKYRLLFRAFFTTDVMPIGIAYIRDMLRDCIVLSDTDSTCGSYDKWIDWYFGYQKFSADAVAISASVMTINTQVMDHFLKIFATNMNVDIDLIETLKMKNEFYWSVFVASNVSKHYYADTLIQEGNVYKEPDSELKGVHFIASAIDQLIVKEGHGIINEIKRLVSSGEQIDLVKYVKQAANLERTLIDKIKKGDAAIFKRDKIKQAASYKLGKEKSAYINHILWEDVFAEKYGHPGDPIYMVIKVPTMLDSKKDMLEYLETIEDLEIKNKLIAFMEKYDKKVISTFRPPLAIIANNGIPDEILKAVNIQRIVLDNLNMVYLTLETVGFYRKKSMLISEMGY